MKQTKASTSDQDHTYYEDFIHNSSEGIWRIEVDKPISTELPVKEQIKQFYKYAYLAEANPAMARMYGFRSVKPLIGLRLGDLLVESDPANTAYLAAFIDSAYNLTGVESHETDKNGKDKYFRNSLVGLIKNGHLIRAWGTQQDITKEKQATRALERSEERLTLALHASSLGIWEWNIITGKLYWSPDLKRVFGLKPSDVITYEKYLSLIHPDDRQFTQLSIQESMRTGEPYQFEHRTIWPDGTVHWVLGKGQAILKNNKPVRMIGTSLDIDDQKKVEAVLQRQNTYLNILHDTAIEIGMQFDQHNPFLETLLKQAGEITQTEHGYIYLLSADEKSMEVQIAMGMFKSYLGHKIKPGEGIAGTVWKTGKQVKVRDYDTWDKRQKSFPHGVFKAAIGIPLTSKGRVIGVFVLGHKKAHIRFETEQTIALEQLADLASIILNNTRLFQELQESEERFRSMVDSTPVMVWLSDVKGDLTYLNKSWLDFAGRREDKPFTSAWSETVHPDDRERGLDLYYRSVNNHEPFVMEYRLRRHDGEYRWVLDQGVPRFSAHGKLQGFIGSCMDIHDVKRANELAVANTQLKTQRAELVALNKAKDDFIALASHQLRTPATAVKQYTSLLINEFAGPLSSDQLKYMRIAYNSNERQLRIINDLLKTAQIDSSRYVLDRQSQDIVPIVQTAIEELEVAFDIKGQIVSFVPQPNAVVNIDASEINLVLVNLLENASKYSYPNSEIKVTIQKAKGWLEITVADNGVGLEKKDSKRIFEKFTRVNNDLSDTVSGTGLGLYWVKQIVSMHGGNIGVSSKPGQGSKFTIRLPL